MTSTKKEVDETLFELKQKGIENILALRGDIPNNIPTSELPNDFKYASDLVKHIDHQMIFLLEVLVTQKVTLTQRHLTRTFGI